MKTIHPGHLEHRFCIFGCQILCITDLAIMPQIEVAKHYALLTLFTLETLFAGTSSLDEDYKNVLLGAPRPKPSFCSRLYV